MANASTEMYGPMTGDLDLEVTGHHGQWPLAIDHGDRSKASLLLVSRVVVAVGRLLVAGCVEQVLSYNPVLSPLFTWLAFSTEYI